MHTRLLVIVAVLAVTCAEAQPRVSREQYLAAMQRALGDVITKSQALRSQAGRASSAARAPRMDVNLFYAHEAAIQQTPLDTLRRAVDAFADAGVRRIDINMGLFPWADRDQQVIEKYDAIIAHIRSRGMQLGINPQYSPVRRKIASFSEWRTAAIPVFEEIAARYMPDNFVVVHEPTTMSTRMGRRASETEWRDFARDAARAVKRKSPKSRIGAGGLHTEEGYLNAFLELPEVEVLTIDIYQLIALPVFNRVINRARKAGKPVYIEETWRPPYYEPRPGLTLEQLFAKSVGDRAFEDLDVRWLRAMHAYAVAQGLESVTPFWMQVFFKYVDGEGDALDPAYNRQVVEAINRGERTRTYEALRDLARNAR